jgi:hypothetical protein
LKAEKASKKDIACCPRSVQINKKKLQEMGLNIWLRYVGDVYATVTNKGVEVEILLFLNSQHPNIKFTVELESNDTMPFLNL